MDIEGAEVLALSGAERTLSRHRPRMVIELHGTVAGSVLSTLERHGYVVHAHLDPDRPESMQPITTDDVATLPPFPQILALPERKA